MTVFDAIYRENRWRGRESRSGPGSGQAATMETAEELQHLVSDLGIRSVLDFGCGDGYWMPDLPGYVGYDASFEAIRLARRNHPDREYAVTLPLRRHDLVILRDVLQHLPLQRARYILSAARSNAKWLLASTFIGGENVNVPEGGAYSPDLTAAPFNLPEPERMIFDGWGYELPVRVRDKRKHLGLWRL